MAVITVSASGASVSDVTLDDTLQPGSDVAATDTTYYFVDGASTLRSLFIGSSIEVDVGYFSSATLSGTGNVTGATNPSATLPALVNYGVLDINGAIDVAFSNYNQVVVSAGERLDLEGDLLGLSASIFTVAAGGEFDINSQNSAIVGPLVSQGTLRVTAPNTTISGASTLGGTILVQGDAANAVGSGTAAARSTGNANGTYVATLDLRQATLSAPISNLTLGTDALVRFGTGTTTVQRLVVAGSAAGVQPLDVVSVDGTLLVSGDGSGAANQVSVAQAEFTGGTVDFTVAASGGGARLQGQIVADGNTTLRNDGTMTIGGSGTAAATIGSSAAAAGSSFVNGASGQLTLTAGAMLSVASLQNAGTITVAGGVSFGQALANTGTIDVTAGALSLEATVSGGGTIAVENGATLSVDAGAAGGTVALRTGGTLRLSQPASFGATIQMPAIGGRIDLAGIGVTSATVSNGSIAVTTASGTFNLAETGLINGTTLAVGSDGAGGSLLFVSANTQTHPLAYRFFDSVHGTQFLTTSLTETQTVQATRPDLVYEGVGLSAANQAIDPAAAPVFRFFDTKFGTHFYTSSTTERDSVIASRPDLVNEGIGFYEHTAAQPGDVAVYRYFDTNAGTHFYTSSATERTTIAATRPDLVAEGISFYAPSTT